MEIPRFDKLFQDEIEQTTIIEKNEDFDYYE